MVALIVGLALVVVLVASLTKLRRLAELHHGYYGAALAGLGAALDRTFLVYIGLVLLLDDDIQHLAEALGLRPRMGDFTPIHKLGAWLMGIDWKKQGMWLPLAIAGLMAVAAVFCAVHFGV